MDASNAVGVVLETLTKATSQEASILKPAEKQLKGWETHPGFYSTLQVKLFNQTLEENFE